MSGKHKIEFDWPDTGKLEIDVDENHSALLRFTPSPIVVSETLAKFSKTSGNQVLDKSNKTTHHNENKPPQSKFEP